MFSLLDPRLYIVIAVMCGAAYGGGRFQQWRADERSHAADMALAAEKAREAERNAEKANRGIADALSEANRRAATSGRLAADRLRALSAARSEAAAACSRVDEPAAGTLPDVTRENLVREAERADDLARRLEALQAYVREVVKP